MGTNERRLREKVKRRADIVDAARSLFFTKGLRDTTVDDIAQQTELARGTIYLYFNNKEEIYATLLEEGLKLLNDLVFKSYNPKADPLTNVLAGHDAFLIFHDKYPQYYTMLVTDKTEILSGISEEMKERLDSRYMSIVKWIARCLTEGIEKGIFRPMPVQEVAVMQMGVALGCTQMIDRCTGSTVPMDRWRSREVLHDLIANGIMIREKAGS
jgi:AcrR family transcriptional regulator